MTDTTPGLPGRLGPFRVLRLLGEGGMGRVYLAEQDSPRREVALKVLGGAGASTEFQQRFRRESELLAALEHPNIARLYAAGSADTPAGPVPYLAMEYVRGSDLATHARERGLSRRERLALVARIARAVHFAHTRGVIHRDLKPANILVDEHGEPKVLDFGVAHVAGRDGATQMTQAGAFLGTVPYTPLEQLAAGATQVDPRWDVYALGVIAYELLSGSLPYPGLSKATVLSALREILATAPVRLSKPVPDARGDLETLVMKAMAADPAQRYASAAEFAADIERFLQQRPIDARPPTARYLLSMFVRRHKALAVAVALAGVTLVAATLVSLQFALAARERAAEAGAVSEFVEQMITSADPEHDLGNALTVRQVVTAAQARLAAQAQLPPAVSGRLQRLLGKTLSSLGEGDAAVAALEQAVARACGDAASGDCIETRLQLATSLRQKGAYPRARQELREVLDTLGAAPDGAPLRRRLAAQHELGAALLEDAQVAEAKPLLQRTHDEAVAKLGGDDLQTLAIAHDQGDLLSVAGEHADAIRLLETVVAARTRLLGEDHPSTLDSRNTLASVIFRSGDPAKAEPILRDVAARRERVLGAGHIGTITARQNVAIALIQQGKDAEALPIAEDVLAATRAYFGSDHRRTLTMMNTVAYAQEDLGRFEAAAATYREILAIVEARGQADEPEYLSIRNNLAMLLGKSGKSAEARRHFEDLQARAQRVLPAGHPYLGIFAGNYGEFLANVGRAREALPLLEQSLAAALKDFGETHARTAKARARLDAARQRLDRR